MRGIAGVVAVSIAMVGCGDNSTICGPGTNDVDGVCAATASCGPGTMDDGTGTCVPAGSDCQDGTVLIGNACVDPARGLHIDVEDGMEPNGLGVTFGVETSDNEAGDITLQPEGVTTGADAVIGVQNQVDEQSLQLRSSPRSHRTARSA